MFPYSTNFRISKPPNPHNDIRSPGAFWANESEEMKIRIKLTPRQKACFCSCTFDNIITDLYHEFDSLRVAYNVDEIIIDVCLVTLEFTAFPSNSGFRTCQEQRAR